VLENVSFAKLLEMIATGELAAESRGVDGAELRPIRRIVGSRHLLPSTSAHRSAFQPGMPDCQTLLRETSMMGDGAHAAGRKTGALFIERRDRTGAPQRKNLFDARAAASRASSDRAELLGEYLVRRGKLGRAELETALSTLHEQESARRHLIGMGMVDGVDVFQAIRDQGRDRVAALCGWPREHRHFLSGHGSSARGVSARPRSREPDDGRRDRLFAGDPGALLPDDDVRIAPGPRRTIWRWITKRRARRRGSLPLIPQLSPGSTRSPRDRRAHRPSRHGDPGRSATPGQRAGDQRQRGLCGAGNGPLPRLDRILSEKSAARRAPIGYCPSPGRHGAPRRPQPGHFSHSVAHRAAIEEVSR
jgi:hypothetical protein